MGIKFQSPIDLSAHRAIRHSDTAQTLEVKVVTKTAAHPEHGNGSGNGYTIDGIEGAYLEFTPGNKYYFDQSDSSNTGHPLLFYEDAAKTTAYTTGVTNNHSTTAPGNSGSYTQIIPTTTTPPVLFYQCSNHPLMGSYVKFGTGTIGDTYSINATQDGDHVDLNLDAASGTDSTVQLNAGSNITLTRDNANQVTIASTASGDTYDLNATQDGSNVDINLTSGSGNDNSTVQLTAGSNVTLTRNGAQEVTIAASGGSQGITIQDEGGALSTLATTLNFTGSGVTASGTGATKTIDISGGGGAGSGTVTIEKNVYTGDGSTATFNTSSTIANENNVQIYIDGVYQSKDNYTTSGSTVTMSTAPGNGTSVELIQFVAISGNVVAVDNFTGNGSTTAFNLTLSVSNKNNTQVYIDGVYQDKSTYTISSTTLTFSPAPGNGAKIEVVHIKASSGSGSGISWDSSIQTANFTAAANEGYFINTTSSTITMTMPSSPSVGDTVAVIDAFFKFQTNALTIASSDKINGSTNNFLLNTVGKAVEMVYSGSSRGWLVANDADGHAAEEVMEYLVVAGGGAGGNYLGGGGGAGGVRSGSFVPTSGVQYTATVGTGGAGVSTQANAATSNSGGNSSLAGSGITTISSTGGGGAGSYNGGTGASGGSGGGGGLTENSGAPAGGTGNAGQYSPAEGFNGGNGTYRSPGNVYGPAGAGGGASEAGDNGLPNQGIPAGGHKGGDGVSSSITGSAVVYGGGGGCNNYNGSTANGLSLGGNGGGGNGTNGTVQTGSNGTDGLGGGGGGGSSNGSGSGKGGDGGDGVVILKIPTLYYTGTTTGSPTISSSGAHTIIKFTGAGTYTH